MSKPVKNLIVDTYKKRFEGVSGAVLVDVRGVDSNTNNRFRADLGGKQIKVTVIKNSLAKKAFENTDMAAINELLDGSVAVVYPAEGDQTVVNVARELITWAKEIPSLEFKGALMEGMTFGADEIDALSKYPTREEAQAQVVQILLTPAQNLVGAALGPGRKVASLVKAVEEKLEKGEEIKAA
ncbi:50S ribosomal protein L10 [Phycisphaerales bacterium AB-hyl4]|uniref:Large ribosomal subunit protein uL10 n=1 Tax=Natronomicrosphaera hydrolytica TaxID=3242702 RepID=A0ABV4U569_9BACT